MAWKILSHSRCRDGAGDEYEHIEAKAATTDELPTEGIPDGSGVLLYDPSTGEMSYKNFDAASGAWV